MRCNNCEKEIEPKLSKSGQHTRADCPDCGRYIKFVPREVEPSVYVIHFGKYKSKTLGYIKQEDPEYLRWLFDVSKPRLRELIDKILSDE